MKESEYEKVKIVKDYPYESSEIGIYHHYFELGLDRKLGEGNVLMRDGYHDITVSYDHDPPYYDEDEKCFRTICLIDGGKFSQDDRFNNWQLSIGTEFSVDKERNKTFIELTMELRKDIKRREEEQQTRKQKLDSGYLEFSYRVSSKDEVRRKVLFMTKEQIEITEKLL
jgi:hypothetical protein